MSFRDIQFRTTRNECGIRWTIIKSSWNFTWQTIIANREHETWLNKIRILDHLNNQPTPRRKKIPIQVINPFFKRGVITSRRLESRNEERLFKKIVSLKIDKRSNLFLLSIVSTKSNFPPSFSSQKCSISGNLPSVRRTLLEQIERWWLRHKLLPNFSTNVSYTVKSNPESA